MPSHLGVKKRLQIIAFICKKEADYCYSPLNNTYNWAFKEEFLGYLFAFRGCLGRREKKLSEPFPMHRTNQGWKEPAYQHFILRSARQCAERPPALLVERRHGAAVAIRVYVVGRRQAFLRSETHCICTTNHTPGSDRFWFSNASIMSRQGKTFPLLGMTYSRIFPI